MSNNYTKQSTNRSGSVYLSYEEYSSYKAWLLSQQLKEPSAPVNVFTYLENKQSAKRQSAFESDCPPSKIAASLPVVSVQEHQAA